MSAAERGLSSSSRGVLAANEEMNHCVWFGKNEEMNHYMWFGKKNEDLNDYIRLGSE